MSEDSDQRQSLVGCKYIIRDSAIERDWCGFPGIIVGSQEKDIIKDQACPFPDVSLASSSQHALLQMLL